VIARNHPRPFDTASGPEVETELLATEGLWTKSESRPRAASTIIRAPIAISRRGRWRRRWGGDRRRAGRDLSDEAFAELCDALYRHKMIFCAASSSAMTITPASACASALSARTLTRRGVEGFPGVQPVIKEAETRAKSIFGGS